MKNPPHLQTIREDDLDNDDPRKAPYFSPLPSVTIPSIMSLIE
jgi:hypothetical protein